MELCNPNKHEICIMTNVKGLKFTLRSNDVSEMSLNVYRTINEIDFPEYGMVRKMRMIHVDGLGYFVIQEVNEVFENEIPYKEVTLYSAEYMLNYKPVNLALITMVSGGTTTFAKSYKFYDREYPKDTLMYRLFAGADFKDWTFDYDSIPESIMEKYRSFDDSGDGLYGFLQNYVSTSYDCIFTYDIENYIVSVHKKDELVKPTDITLSMDNLMKRAELKELSDEISTVLSVKGSDKLSLSKVNPNGTNNIYKFDYYLKEEWIGEDFTVASVTFDKDGNVIYNASGNPILTTMKFTEHVKLWEEKIKEIINSASVVGSYGYLLTAYTYLSMQYNIISAYHTQAEYIYNYCTEAIASYKEETKEQKRSIWGSILFGVGIAVLAIAGVALAAYTAGGSLAASGTAIMALASGSATAVATATGAAGVAGTLAAVAATTTFTTGASIAFQGLFQLGALAYQTNITKDQMKKYQEVAQKNMDTYKSGGGYVYNLTAETLTNLVTGRNNEFVVGEPLLWISKSYSEDSILNTCKKRPEDTNVQKTVGQKYCLDVLEKKLNYITDRINMYNKIYAFKNWFSNAEQLALQPFLIQSEYSDESFTATDDIDVDGAQDVTKYITTTEGTMTIEEYRSATDGFLIKYICKGDIVNYEATPMKFNQDKFRDWLVSQNDWKQYANDKRNAEGSFYLLYDGIQWLISNNKTGSIINSIIASGDKFPNSCGITSDTHDGKYSYKPVSGDYMLLNLYSDNITLVDTLTVAKQLAQQGYDVLDECSEPSFSFSVDSNNFTLLPEYKQWTEQLGFDGDGLTLGTMINVVYVDDQVLTPFIQEISYEYDNPDSLTFTFGNKFNLGTSEYALGKIFSNNTSTVQRVQRALIGTSSVSGGSSDSRNNSSAIASTNDTIGKITDKGGLIDTAVSDSAKKQGEEYEAKLEAERKTRKQEIDDAIITCTNRINEAIDNMHLEKKISDHVNKVNAVIAGGLGLYTTRIGSEQTGYRYIMHNGETLSTSTVYYYCSSGGFAWKSFSIPGYFQNVDQIVNYTQWNTGITRDGDMVARDLSARKILANQIEGKQIGAQHIVAGGINAKDIVAMGTITANEIKAGSIYADNLARDAVFKRLWVNNNPSAGFGSGYINIPGLSKEYSGVFVYTYPTNGSCASCIVSIGNSASLISGAESAGQGTNGNWIFGAGTNSYDSIATRQVTCYTEKVYFGYCKFLRFGNFSFTTALAGLKSTVGVNPTYGNTVNYNIPGYIYGYRLGV